MTEAGARLPQRIHRRLTGAGGPPSRGRRVLVYALITLAMLLTIVSSLTLWLDRQALDTDAWVDASDQLLADPEVRELAAARMVDALFANQDIQARLEQRLPPDLDPLAAPAAGLVRQAAQPAAERLLARPATQRLWSEANRRAHTRLVEVLEGDEPGALTTDEAGRVVLDLTPLVTRLGEDLGLSVTLPPDSGQIVIADGERLDRARDAVDAIQKGSVLLTVVVLALLVIAVYLATGFRREALRGIGVGLVLAGLVLLVVRRIAGDWLVDDLTNAVSEPAGAAIWLIATELLRDISLALIGYGAALLIGAWLAGGTRPARALRRWAAPVLRDSPAVAYAVVALLVLLVLLWGPTPATQRLTGVIVLAALVAIGLVALRRQVLREHPG